MNQGLDTTEVSPTRKLDADLVETQYLIEMDSRFGQLINTAGTTLAAVSYIDDDQIASYYLSLGTDATFVEDNSSIKVIGDGGDAQTIAGPRGTVLTFKVQSSLDLVSSTYYFTLVGTTTSLGGHTFYMIDTNVRVTGVTTGYRLDVPIRYLKYISTP